MCIKTLKLNSENWKTKKKSFIGSAIKIIILNFGANVGQEKQLFFPQTFAHFKAKCHFN